MGATHTHRGDRDGAAGDRDGDDPCNRESHRDRDDAAASNRGGRGYGRDLESVGVSPGIQTDHAALINPGSGWDANRNLYSSKKKIAT